MSYLSILLNDQIANSALWVLTDSSITDPLKKKISLHS